jgi:hypothetical protein
MDWFADRQKKSRQCWRLKSIQGGVKKQSGQEPLGVHDVVDRGAAWAEKVYGELMFGVW